MLEIVVPVHHHDVVQKHISLTFHIRLWNLPLGASSCTTNFVLLSRELWLLLSCLSENPSLYILVSSLDEQGATHIGYELH